MSKFKQPVHYKRAIVESAQEWLGKLTLMTMFFLFYEMASGFSLLLLPFGEFNQVTVVLHTVIGLILLPAVCVYMAWHWLKRKGGNFNHYQLLGYLAMLALLVCCVSGVVLAYEAAFLTRITPMWSQIHLISTFLVLLLTLFHLLLPILRTVKQAQAPRIQSMAWANGLRRAFAGACGVLVLSGGALIVLDTPAPSTRFPADYNWKFGADRPFAPSMARVRQSGGETQQAAVRPQALANSPSCGTTGCHEQIYEEWLPSAHRYAALDQLFQEVQTIMAQETSPEQTRYCAGCHDPISLFSGAKNAKNITLSAKGYEEGISCAVCHSIVQADTQGNADYVLHPPTPYLFENSETSLAQSINHFLIRAYPGHHVQSYSRPLYKTAEFCAACHKQYIDKEVNRDIGRVQGQNQYDSWRKSHWHDPADKRKTLSCRDCHMPLQESRDPAAGDSIDEARLANDGKHRSHRTLGGNQFIPKFHDLENAEEHTRLIEQWLRGEYEIPEIQDKWADGPVVIVEILCPDKLMAGQKADIQVLLTNNKTGHDFPTGPLDLIESWVEFTVKDQHENIIYQAGALDDGGEILSAPIVFKADLFDRQGRLIDRHNLWDLVGANSKRMLFPGMTDSFHLSFFCPSTAQSEAQPAQERKGDFAFTLPETNAISAITVSADLWYRKSNTVFLDRLFGKEGRIRAPITKLSSASKTIEVSGHETQTRQ